MLANRFGRFDPSGRAFTITDRRTPMPWVNVICNGRYGLVVSQNGGGFSWYDDAQHNVLTRWEMDLVRDCYGKFLYCADLDAGRVWSLAPAPTFPAYTRYECTHTLGATTFTTEYDGIRAVWTLAVAHDQPVELWAVELQNNTDRTRRLRLSSYFEWTCGVAPDVKREFHRLFFTTKHDAQRRAIIATKNMWDIPPRSEKDHWNQPWPYVAAHCVGGFRFERQFAVADKSRFLGRYTPTTAPEAMTGEGVETGGFGRFGDACAALGGDLVLDPHGIAKGYYLIAIGETEKLLKKHLDDFRDGARVDAAMNAAKGAWLRRLSPTSIESDRPDFDALNNYWLAYQAISGRMWGRTGYYQQSGAFGFRDQLQDSQVWLALEPKRALDQILLHAGKQFSDGSVWHWWHALADFGNHMACSDDYLWLPFVVASYLKETGDFAALERTAPWLPSSRARASVPGKRPAGQEQADTLREHCTRAIARALGRMSERGLPLIGSCDWNDGLSAMGIAEKGESNWLGMFLAHVLADWAHIHETVGEKKLAKEYGERRAKLIAALEAHGWDGAWYRYGTKDSGEAVGSSTCAEGKIHLNAQTWAIIAETAPAERARSAWASVKEQLLSAYGPLLLAPAYTVPDGDLGYITRYSPGSRENGGVYMHAATWALMAACKVKDHAAVSSIWASISPATRGQDPDSYWAEPYVTPGNVDGPLSDKPGRAGWTWYTGSAAWLNRVCMEWVLGIRPTWEGLLIDPCPAKELGKVSVTRTWRGKAVHVRFDAADFKPGVKPVLTVNGRIVGSGVIPPSMATGAKRLEVQVSWPGTAWVEAAPKANKAGAEGEGARVPARKSTLKVHSSRRQRP